MNPAEDVEAKRNPSKKLKDFLDPEEYIQLLRTSIYNAEVKEAFLVSCYTGLRWCDVKELRWEDIKENEITTRIIQAKTGLPVVITMHPIVQNILFKRKEIMVNTLHRESPQQIKGLVFSMLTANGCNKALKQWMKDAGINKHITWHCARLSFSIILQDARVDTATVALLLGHTTTRYVDEVYKRHRPKNQEEVIGLLPAIEDLEFSEM